jgi:hypothetical protein
MIKILFFNGSYNRTNRVSSKDLQVGNTIIMASNEGRHFRGKPEDMARDAICHINEEIGYELGLFPVILSSKEETDVEGKFYTTKVVFQAIF